MKTVRLLLCGMGNVHRNFLRILESQRDRLREWYGLDLVVVGVTDSGGAAFDGAGFESHVILTAKAAGRSVAALPGGRAGMGGVALLDVVSADLLLEATTVSLRDGQPGLDAVRAALRRGASVVLANKGPLALAFQELDALARQNRARMSYSACVGGALPTINIGVRDLAGARVTKVEAMVNGTCQGILRLMETGRSFADALAEMQSRGVVEADPSLDIDGWDAAAKLTIIANAVLRRPTTIADVRVSGIRGLSEADLRAAAARGERWVLLGRAERRGGAPDGDWDLSVAAEPVPQTHPLARMSGDEMGVVYHTDISGVISAAVLETDAMPTAAAMLRDVVALAAADFR